MSLRLLFWSALFSGGLLAWHGLRLSSLDPAVLLPWLGLSVVGAVGRLAAVFRPTWGNGWRRLWALLLGALWLALAWAPLRDQLSGLTAVGLLALETLRHFGVPTALLLGYLALLWRSEDQRTGPLGWLFPVLLSGLALAVPEAPGAAWLPLLAGLGLGVPVEGEADWAEASGGALEGAALQTVAWGALLSAGGFLAEAAQGRVWSALFLLGGTGVACWIGSGLLWGAAQALRAERWPLRRLARGLLGPEAV